MNRESKRDLFLAYAGLVKLFNLRRDMIEDMLSFTPYRDEQEDYRSFFKNPLSFSKALEENMGLLKTGLKSVMEKISKLEDTREEPSCLQRLASHFRLSREEADILLCLFFKHIGFLDSFHINIRGEGQELLMGVLESSYDIFFALPLLSKEGKLLKNGLIKIEDEDKSLLTTRYTLNDSIAVSLALDFGLGGKSAEVFLEEKLDLSEDPLLSRIEPGSQGIDALSLPPSAKASLKEFAQNFLFEAPSRIPGIELIVKDRELGLKVLKALALELKAEVALVRLPIMPSSHGLGEERLKSLLRGTKKPLLLAIEAGNLSKQRLKQAPLALAHTGAAILTGKPLGIFKTQADLTKKEEKA
jgi:hypothetical protein